MRYVTVMALAAVAAAFCLTRPANAATLEPIHAFCDQADCADGNEPRAGLVTDGLGNYYGTTAGGGLHHGGTVYRLHFDGAHWTYKRLHSFCAKTDCVDGNFPESGVIVDMQGGLWGMTSAGGTHAHGTIYKLMPNGEGWDYRVVHSFCAKTDCHDGADPLYAGLAYPGQTTGNLYDPEVSPLYGTTSKGGAIDEGTVFSFQPGVTTGFLRVIHNFCAQPSCTDGVAPGTGVMVDPAGTIFGAAPNGGNLGAGVVYQLKFNGTHWIHTVLHSFCAEFDGSGCPDGFAPYAAPIVDEAGNLFGTTSGGGSFAEGTVYKLTVHGAHSKLTVLHEFCAEAKCADGAVVSNGLVMGGTGGLFGTTLQGGYHDGGTLFALTGIKHTKFAKLMTFKVKQGVRPYSTLTIGPSGVLLGTLSVGGKNSGGIVFSVTP